jgi:hypothetical protein
LKKGLRFKGTRPHKIHKIHGFLGAVRFYGATIGLLLATKVELKDRLFKLYRVANICLFLVPLEYTDPDLTYKNAIKTDEALFTVMEDGAGVLELTWDRNRGAILIRC